MNARKMTKQKKPAKAEASKSGGRRTAAAETFDEDEPGTSKRPKSGATSPGSSKSPSAKSKPSKTAAKGKSSNASAGAGAGKSKAAPKAKPAPAKGKAATTSPGKTKAAPSKSAGKAKGAASKSTSAGKGKVAPQAKQAAGKRKAAKDDAAKGATSKTPKGAAAKQRSREGDRPDLEVILEEVLSDELEGSEVAAEDAEHSDAVREAGAGTITEDDDWLDEAEDRADSTARDGDERGEPLMSDISEIRVPRDPDAELAEGEVELGKDMSADSQPAPTTRAHLKRVVESLIFVSEQAVTANQLARLVKSKAAEVREVVTEIMRDYDGRGIELVEVGGGFQFRSAAASAPFVRDLVSARPVRLTRAQLETLALIAYRQPITRPEIDDVRGVDSGSAIKVLLDRDLVKILGRKDEAGRPLLYGTAPAFLEFFGMNSLQDLPTLREFTELSEENRELFAKKMGEVPEDLSDPAFVPAVQHQEYDEEGNPIAPVIEPAEGDAQAADAEATDVEREDALDHEEPSAEGDDNAEAESVEDEPGEVQDRAEYDAEESDEDEDEDEADEDESDDSDEDEDEDVEDEGESEEVQDRAEYDAEGSDEDEDEDEADEDETDQVRDRAAYDAEESDADEDEGEDADEDEADDAEEDEDDDSDEDEVDDEAVAHAEESDDDEADEDEVVDDEAVEHAEESDDDQDEDEDEDEDDEEEDEDDEAVAQAEESDEDESDEDVDEAEDEDEDDDEDEDEDSDGDEDDEDEDDVK